MFEDLTPEVVAHLRRVCDHLERAAIALPYDLIGRVLGTVDEMLSFVGTEREDDVPMARLPLPDVRGILDALLDARAHERPVSATEVAQVLWYGEHGHGDLCRLGQRLRLLSDFGMLVRHAPPIDSGHANRWSLATS